MRITIATVGHVSGTSFRISTELHGVERVSGNMIHGHVADGWKRLLVLSGVGPDHRLFVLEPTETEEAITFGPFFVRGGFKIVEKVNNSRLARERWDAR